MNAYLTKGVAGRQSAILRADLVDADKEIPAVVSVMLADGHAATRERLRRVLRDAPEIRCLAAYAGGRDVIQETWMERPDVVLIGTGLKDIDVVECATGLKATLPEVQVLVVSRGGDHELAVEALRMGANGCVLGSASRAELVGAIQQVRAGGAPVPERLLRDVVGRLQGQPAAEAISKLSEREQQTLELLVAGLSYSAIGRQLGITLSTVRAHLHAVYGKLEVQNRTQAANKFLSVKRDTRRRRKEAPKTRTPLVAELQA